MDMLETLNHVVKLCREDPAAVTRFLVDNLPRSDVERLAELLRSHASGVQDRATRDQLERLGCDVMQGQFTGMPMERDELIERGTLEPAQPAAVSAEG